MPIRTGLFERHNVGGKASENMQPFGSSVRPEVELEFEIDGQRYTIGKGFAQKPSARLSTPNGTFEGPAAEEKLAELLRFRHAQRGASKPEDQGVLGLFYLEQGRVIDGLKVGDQGQATLRGALEEEVGDVLGGPQGQKLLRAASAKRNELLTATGKPRGELDKAIKEAAALTDQADELEGDRQKYEEQIDKLDQKRRQLQQIERDGDIDKARQSLRQTQEWVSEVEQLQAHGRLGIFDQPDRSLDAVAVLLRGLHARLGLISRVASVLGDKRDLSKVRHSLEDLWQQRVLAIAGGYEDGNDAARLRFDPIQKSLLTVHANSRASRRERCQLAGRPAEMLS